MAKITLSREFFPNDDRPSADAKKILRHLRDHHFAQDVYEYPENLRKLFSNVEDCENALAELESHGLVQRLGMAPNATDRVTATALTLDGVRYVAKHDLG